VFGDYSWSGSSWSFGQRAQLSRMRPPFVTVRPGESLARAISMAPYTIGLRSHIYLAPGTHFLFGDITLDRPLRIFGAGPDSIIKRCTDCSLILTDHCELDNIQFLSYGDESVRSEYPIVMDGLSAAVRGVRIFDCAGGIRVSADGDEAHVAGCRIQELELTTGNKGILVEAGATHFSIKENWVGELPRVNGDIYLTQTSTNGIVCENHVGGTIEHWAVDAHVVANNQALITAH